MRQGTESVAEALCRAGADTASSSTGEPPLWQVLEPGAEDMASILVRHGADTDGLGTGPEQQKLLHRAVDENKEAAIFLIRAVCHLDGARCGGDCKSLLFFISINVNVHSKTTDSNNLASVQVGQKMMVRNLLLAGSSTQERSLAGQTGFHLPAESDFNAVDELGNNALHVAVKEGHIKTARVLLTESQVSAELANSMGRSPLHELAKFADTNAVEMLDLFLECITDYNIDRPACTL